MDLSTIHYANASEIPQCIPNTEFFAMLPYITTVDSAKKLAIYCLIVGWILGATCIYLNNKYGKKGDE